MKIYIVTSGEYSDYCIEAVFTNKEKAMAYCACHNRNIIEDAIAKKSCYIDEFRIEEYDTADDSLLINPSAKYGYFFNGDSVRASLNYTWYPGGVLCSKPEQEDLNGNIFVGDICYEKARAKAKKIMEDRIAKEKVVDAFLDGLKEELIK